MARTKRRSDRNHVIYQIECLATGDTYIGLTVARGGAFQGSAKIRFQGHVNHATKEKRPYPIHNRIRKYGPNAFQVEVLEIVRGKTEAHMRERELIEELQPTLNVEGTGRKLRPGQGNRRRGARKYGSNGNMVLRTMTVSHIKNWRPKIG